MTIIPERLAALDTITLDDGGHTDFEEGACLLEAVSYVAGEPFSDHPQCASQILGAFGRKLNDTLPHDKRQHLVPLVPRIVGTANDGQDQARGLMAADWLIRVYTPTWLRLAGQEEQAVSLETLPRQASWDDVETAVPTVREAKKKAAAAGAATWAAAGDAAGVAARAAAGAAAWDAAGDAAWDAAGAAARDAARDATRDATRAATRDATRAAARDATRAAARDALQPTVDALQDSAIELFTSMIDPSQVNS